VDVDEFPAAADRALALALATCAVDVDEVEAARVAGTGTAFKRINAAKLTMSCEKSDDGLPLVVVFTRLVVLSGIGLNWQILPKQDHEFTS
jgi:hypothetical protein